LAWIGGFNDMAGFVLLGLQNEEKLHFGSPVYFNQESHEPSRISLSGHQRPKKGFVNARYLEVEGLTTFEKSLY
jgi:hypothetical protein